MREVVLRSLSLARGFKTGVCLSQAPFSFHIGTSMLVCDKAFASPLIRHLMAAIVHSTSVRRVLEQGFF